MVYKNKEEENSAIDQAWNALYQRLEREGLITKEVSGNHQRQLIADASKFAVAAAIIIACIFSGWYFTRKKRLHNETMLVLYNEAQAPTLATMLGDGSVVYLSEQTSLKYPERFAEDKREVFLQGEAFFEIKNQPGRPFVIDTEIAGVEVKGTSFKIKSEHGTSFSLSVREGEVRVTQKNGHQSLSVQAGETAIFDAGQIQLEKSDAGFNEFFSHIRFKDERLDDVAAIINLHLKTLQLKIDPAVGNRILTFTFIVNGNITETAGLICKALDLHLSQHDHILYISKPE